MPGPDSVTGVPPLLPLVNISTVAELSGKRSSPVANSPSLGISGADPFTTAKVASDGAVTSWQLLMTATEE